MLESETDLSYERLLRLYKEVSGKSPSKGQLPFSTDWFMTWQPNIHASLFLNIHEYLNKAAEMDEIQTVIKAYQLYLEQTQNQGLEALLSVTRAWRLVKFIDNGMLTVTKCSKCGGHFVNHPTKFPPLCLWSVQPTRTRRRGQGFWCDPDALKRPRFLSLLSIVDCSVDCMSFGPRIPGSEAFLPSQAKSRTGFKAISLPLR